MDKNGQNRGRPTIYDVLLLEKLWDYIKNPTDFNDPVPTIEGACDELGISKQAAYEWEAIHPEFGDALQALRTKQGRLLQSYGLLGKTNSVITKLMLSANHGVHETSEQIVRKHTYDDFVTKPEPAGTANEAEQKAKQEEWPE